MIVMQYDGYGGECKLLCCISETITSLRSPASIFIRIISVLMVQLNVFHSFFSESFHIIVFFFLIEFCLIFEGIYSCICTDLCFVHVNQQYVYKNWTYNGAYSCYKSLHKSYFLENLVVCHSYRLNHDIFNGESGHKPLLVVRIQIHILQHLWIKHFANI